MILRLARGVERIDADGSPMLFNTRTGGYFALNDSAATALTALIGHGEPEGAAALVDTYGITTDQAAADVRALTESLTGHRLLEAR
ncbi:PqqD family peptide modification chaperone [Streptomyces sp. NPDC020719]|uniref:PqqD family peptide modification chaperone n=1 Tax=Streptomyces sp. NPDC020719 TaxID=3154896 RepID=UPI0033DA8D74